jgi:hypothetical protein
MNRTQGIFAGFSSFENGKIANPICEMVKLRSPFFIMVESPFSRKQRVQVTDGPQLPSHYE